MDVLHLTIAGIEVDAVVENEVAMTSPHTGRALSQFEVSVKVIGAIEAERLREEIGGGEPATLAVDKQGREYDIRLRSISYSDLSPTSSFILDLTEREALDAQRVVLDGRIALAPERYQETFQRGGLFVRLLTTTDSPTTADLEALIVAGPKYFNVTRDGIEDQPRLMRFGQCRWSEESEGRRYVVVLVEKASDDAEPLGPGLLEPNRTRIEESLAVVEGALEQLASLLIAQEAIEADAWRVALESASDPGEIRRRRRQFLRVTDIEAEWRV